MKFGHLIEYNTRNILFGKSKSKCDGKPSTRPFYKKLKFSIPLHQQCEGL